MSSTLTIRTISAREERGQAAPLVLVVLAMGVVMVLGTARLATDVVSAGRARTAADAAALAGVEGGQAASASIAAANGATLVSWRVEVGADGHRRVTVEVRVGRASATAAASNAPEAESG